MNSSISSGNLAGTLTSQLLSVLARKATRFFRRHLGYMFVRRKQLWIDIRDCIVHNEITEGWFLMDMYNYPLYSCEHQGCITLLLGDFTYKKLIRLCSNSTTCITSTQNSSIFECLYKIRVCLFEVVYIVFLKHYKIFQNLTGFNSTFCAMNN